MPDWTPISDALRRAGVRDVRADGTTRAMYSSDASLYRVPPTTVVFPRAVDEVAAVLDVCRAEGVPLTARGAGTSVAGNAVGPGVVLDFSRHLGRVLAVDRRPAPPSSSRVSYRRCCNGRPRRTGCGSVPTRPPTTAAPSAA